MAEGHRVICGMTEEEIDAALDEYAAAVWRQRMAGVHQDENGVWWSGYEGMYVSPDPYGIDDRATLDIVEAERRAVITVLDRYFEMMLAGTAHLIKPDPLYKWRNGDGPDVAELIQAIDSTIVAEMTKNSGLWKPWQPPNFARLLEIEGGAPAVALAQELDNVLGEL